MAPERPDGRSGTGYVRLEETQMPEAGIELRRHEDDWLLLVRPHCEVSADYWLANCDAFLVDDELGRNVGVVHGVEAGPEGVSALLVARRWRGPRVSIPVEEIISILPGERRIVVRDAAHRQDG